MQSYFLKEPTYFEPDRSSVLLVLENNIEMRSRRKTESLLNEQKIKENWEELNYLERREILITIYDKDFITSEETAKIINRGKTTAVKLLNKLIAKNLIEHIGTSKYDNKGMYIIKK